MHRKLTLTIILLILIAAATIWGITAYYEDLPNRISQHETVVLGQSHFTPGSQAALRVVVRDSKDARPLENAEISVALKPNDGGKAISLFSGATDELGTANISFTIPEDTSSNQTLIVETKSELGSDKVERTVTIERDYRVLLTTDKPLYQPGQVIHIRSLALSTFDLTPASKQEMEIIIADGKGNKVFRERFTTSEYGVAAGDFQLATQVNTGAYKITTTMGNTSSEKTVTVERYVLPKFAVELNTDRSFYMPGERVEGSLNSVYFFGKPVAGGHVRLEGYTFDVERTITFELQGTTDDSGNFVFSFDLPAYIAGTDLEGGLGRYYLQASVTDLAEHTEISNTSLPVAASALVIDAIPEGGQFRQGVENILYVLTSYPDGTPAETSLNLNFFETGQEIAVQTGPFGLAEVRLTPASPYQGMLISALDASGASASKEFIFEGEWLDETVLLRPDRPAYIVGDTMQLTILSSLPSGTAYLDIIREGQTVSTRAVDIEEGRAEVAVDLTPDLYGTLELHAYKILSWGGITRDTRLVVVNNASDLNLTLSPDQGEFRPGDEAGMSIQVTGQNGQGAQAAVGLAIVDESVFALAEQDPGFAKLYFLLEQELLQPKYDLHGFSIPDLVTGVPLSSQEAVDAVEDAAMASLAEVAPHTSGFSLQANSHDIPLAIFTLSLLAIWQAGNLWRSLGVGLGLLALLALLLIVWPHPWANDPLEKLGLFFEWIGYSGDETLLALMGLAFLSYIGLIVLAWRRKDRALGWALGLLPLLLVTLGFTVYVAERASASPDESVLILGLVAFALLPLGFLLRAASFGEQRRIFAALGAGLLGLFLIFGTLPVLALSASGGFGAPAVGAVRNLAVEEVMLEGELLAAAPAAEEAPDVDEAGVDAKDDNGTSNTGSGEPPRLRQFFPETMLWIPDAVTETDGTLHLDFPVADSITTWRMTALASTQDGRLGSATGSLRVFQDFFIDLDLPLALTVGDEISIPVGVFNYLESGQTVRLELEQAAWFDLLDEAEKTIEIAPNDITVVYFRVRAEEFGRQPFQVTAWGSQMSDAIRKEVQVYPDGKEIHFTQSDRLTADAPIQQSVSIPADVIPGTQELIVKIYPGVVSQVVEGLDSILRMPYGCFEQTSSTTYPNVLVLDYLKTTDQAAPEVQFKAEEFINLGYQRLTTFEVGGSGGFSLFGDPPPDRMLTAYGLQEFTDMSRVHNVDPALVQRAADWVFSQQASDGTWENDQGLVHENTWSSLGDDRLPVTAYIVWSLVDAGFTDDARTQKALSYLRESQGKAEDPYVVALLANALVAADIAEGGELSSITRTVLDRLASLAVFQGNSATWTSSVATFMGSEGQTGSIETTALAALAFLRANSHPELANAALTALIQQKDSFGTWYSTQATVLSLKALIESVRAGAEDVDASVTVTLNGGQTRTVQVTPENFDVVQLLAFDDINIGRDNTIEITVEGEGNLMYQVSGSYYLPWDKLARYPEAVPSEDLVTIDVAYDRTELAVDDTVKVDVSVTLNEPGGRADWALIDLGLPPGFNVETADLAALVSKFDDIPEDYEFPTVERYELTGRQILVYIGNLSANHPLTFSYNLIAKFPLSAQTPASTAYDYYNPDVSGEAEPQTLVVNP
jgi:uncharacterized protein YfaS (alpha-2-macroglobulin family)